jgi:teichuronic acid biosynthesis glycosyltransferase TuaG
MMKNKPYSQNYLVSIITPLFNCEKFIYETIESVISQDYTNWEMIIVDDCSDDKSVEIVRKLISIDDRIQLIINKTNKGSGHSRNLAIKKAKGEFIAFLDSDDIWSPNKLSIHLDFMHKNNSAFSHTSYGYIDEFGNKIMSTFHVSRNPVKYTDLLKRTEISCLTAMYDVRKIGKMYMPDLRRKQDYALWLDILKLDFKSDPLDLELAYYRQRSNSNTSNKFKLIFDHWKFLRLREKIPFIKSFYYLSCWAFGGLRKYYL